jgi:hypothetical protein
VRDPDKYRTVEVNRDLCRVYKGMTLVGQVRRGLDNLWYAEVGDGVKGRIVAVHRVILANDAIEEFQEAVDGCG